MNPAAFDRAAYLGRLKGLIQLLGGNEAAAEMAHVSTQTMRRWANGVTPANFEGVSVLALDAGASLDRIAFGASGRVSCDDLLAAWTLADVRAKAQFLGTIAGLDVSA